MLADMPIITLFLAVGLDVPEVKGQYFSRVMQDQISP